jgi:S1-C subfamily serine protease
VSSIVNRKQKLARVIVRYAAPNAFGCGSGFFIDSKGSLLTCFHVAFAASADTIKSNEPYKSAAGTEQDKFKAYFSAAISNIEAHHEDGTSTPLDLVDFNADFDLAVLRARTPVDNSKVFETDFDFKFNYGDKVEFIGYPTAAGYPPDKSPFAFNSGVVSSFPETKVAGGIYEHVQINAVNLGGNSGGPLFIEGSEKVVGIVNGNMNWGSDNVAFVDPSNQIRKGTFRAPLGIAYATPLQLLKSKGFID